MPTNNFPEIKAMVILHAALLIGQVAFLLVAFFVVFFGKSALPALAIYSNTLIIVSVVAGAGSFLFSKSVFQKKLDNLKGGQISIQKKVEYYRSASIVRWAIIEFASLLAIILFLVTHNFIIFGIALALVILFFSKKPSLKMVAEDLGISEMEIQQMERPL